MDLSSSMRSPALDLDPGPDLADVVRGRARRVRRRRRAAGSVLGVAAVASAVVLVPGRSPSGGELASEDVTHGIRNATSEVVVLDQLNGGDVVAYYLDDQPCVAAVRVKNRLGCGPGVSAASTAAIPFVFPADDPALRVDTRQLLAGVVGSRTASVRVVVEEGAALVAETSTGTGFVLPFFSVEVPAGAVPTEVDALDAAGRVLDQLTLTR